MASYKKKRYSKRTVNRKTRKMHGGSNGLNVNVVSASLNRYINPTSSSSCIGCRSDNTTAQGAYSLNTPLPDWPPTWNKGIMSGGGQVCTEPPLQYLQKGGKKRKNKTKRRGMKGGGFWDTLGLKPFWSPSNPGAVGYNKGYTVLAPSSYGITPSGGLGPPRSTAGDDPIPKHQSWSAAGVRSPHLYQMGGSTKSRRNIGKKMKGKHYRRGMKGGGILTDIQNMGREMIYQGGKIFNGFAGASNKIYATNPMPSVGQFPRGLLLDKNPNMPNIIASRTPLSTIYKNADSHVANL
jgi:hypothetical protein